MHVGTKTVLGLARVSDGRERFFYRCFGCRLEVHSGAVPFTALSFSPDGGRVEFDESSQQVGNVWEAGAQRLAALRS